MKTFKFNIPRTINETKHKMAENTDNAQNGSDALKGEIASVLKDFHGGAVEVGKFIKDNTSNAVNVIEQQAPQVAKELLIYNAVPKGVAVTGCLIWLCVALYIFSKFKKTAEFMFKTPVDGEEYFITGLMHLPVVLISVPALITFFNDAIFLLQVWLAPKIALAKMLVDLFK